MPLFIFLTSVTSLTQDAVKTVMLRDAYSIAAAVEVLVHSRTELRDYGQFIMIH